MNAALPRPPHTSLCISLRNMQRNAGDDNEKRINAEVGGGERRARNEACMCNIVCACGNFFT